MGRCHTGVYVVCIVVVLLANMNEPFAVAGGSVLLARAGAGAGGVVGHHSDDVQQTGEQLQREVEHTDSEACRKTGSNFTTRTLLWFGQESEAANTNP